MKLYFIRHGETQDNIDNILTGQRDIPLTQHGRAQAKAATAEIKPLGITLIVTSDLSRAVDTARIIASGIGYPEERIVATPDLREVELGSLTGTPDRHEHYVLEMRRHNPTIES